MKAYQWVRLVLSSFAVMSVVGVMAVVACAPAAPSSQSGSGDGEKESPTETPTPTVTPVCHEVPMYGGGTRIGCEMSGPPGTDQSLSAAHNKHMEQKATRAARGGRGEPVEPITVNVRIYVETEGATDRLVEFLEVNAGDARVHVYRATDRWWAGSFRIRGLDAGLIQPIAEMDGVMRMDTIFPFSHGGSRLDQQPSSSFASAVTATQITHADQWHRAVYTGAGVGVAVLDTGFLGEFTS